MWGGGTVCGEEGGAQEKEDEDWEGDCEDDFGGEGVKDLEVAGCLYQEVDLGYCESYS